MANVPHGKQSGNIGFEKKWIAVQRPPFRSAAVPQKIGAGKDESAIVSFDHLSQPLGSGHGADENEHGIGRHAFYLIGVRAQDRNLLQVLVTMHFGYAGTRPQLYVGRSLDLVDEIL